MAIEKLYNPEKGVMRVAGFMSGSGTNLRKIIEHEKRLESGNGRGGAPYRVVVIFSDDKRSNAVQIGSDYNIPVVVRDIRTFYRAIGKPLRDLSAREQFDREIVEALRQFEVSVAAYAGYMSIATAPLINAFFGVNVHPADLSILADGKRKYTGDKAVRDAILSGEKELRATTHLVESVVDEGRILMISPPLRVQLLPDFNPLNDAEVDSMTTMHQSHLKNVGDWVIFPRTLEYLATGRYSQDEKGNLYFDGNPIPQGLRLEAA